MQSSENPTQPTGMSASTIRQLVLIAILIVCLGALGYDRKMARPASESAHADLEKKMDEAFVKNERLDKEATEKVLGKKSPKIRKGEHFQWARYSWMAGVPWKSYDVWVVYEPGQGDKLYCKAVTLNQEPDAQLFDLKRKAASLIELPDGFDPSNDPALNLGGGPSDVPGGGGGGPGAGRGGPGGGRGGPGGGRGGPGGGRGGGRGGDGPNREDRQRPALDDDDAADDDAADDDAADDDAADDDAADDDAAAAEAGDDK